MMGRELINFMWSAWVMRCQLAVLPSAMWRKLPTIFRSTWLVRWKRPIFRRKLGSVLGSTRNLWWKLPSILRTPRRRESVVFYWKLPSFLRSAEVRKWAWWSLGSANRWRSSGIKLMERGASHIWRRYSCHMWRWRSWRHHVGMQRGSRKWRLYHHWRRYHRGVTREHVRSWRRYVRRGLSKSVHCWRLLCTLFFSCCLGSCQLHELFLAHVSKILIVFGSVSICTAGL